MKAHSAVWTRAAPDHSPSTPDLSVHEDRQLKEGDKVAKRGNRCETEMLTPQCLSPPPSERTEWGPHPDVASGSALLSSHAHTVTRGTVPNGPHSPQNPIMKSHVHNECPAAVPVMCWFQEKSFGSISVTWQPSGEGTTPSDTFRKFSYYPWKFGLITERPDEIHE
ncbi:hypothetical protein ACE6H2_013798 [Prunus campanulata]